MISGQAGFISLQWAVDTSAHLSFMKSQGDITSSMMLSCLESKLFKAIYWVSYRLEPNN